MAQIEWATVVSNTTVNDKFRENHRVRVINVTVGNRQNKEAIWFKNPTSFAFLEPGIKIQTIRNEKGKLSILETNPPRQVNGNGLIPIEEPIKQNSGAYQVYSNGQPVEQSTITNGYSQNENNGYSQIQEEGLNLPILSDKEKVQLKQYVAQQVNMFHYLTQEVTKKFPELKANDHRAIAMSIFIDSNKLIQSQK